jgi:hypothetical protein
MIREEHQVVTLRQHNLHAAQRLPRLVLGRALGAAQRNPLIRHHATRRGDGVSFHDVVGGAFLQTRHEEHARLRQSREPGEVHIAAIQDQNCPGRKRLPPGDRHFVALALGDHERRREIAIVIEREVELHGALGPAKRGPSEHLGAQVDHGGIKRQQLVLEAKLVRASHRAAPRQQLVEDLFIESPRPMRIRVRERRAARRGDPQVGELAFAAGQPATNLPQRVRTSELTEQHRHELPPAGEPAGVPFGLRRGHGVLKVGSRKKLEQLTEDAAKSRHRGWPPSEMVKRENSAIIICECSTPFVFRYAPVRAG